MNLLAQKQNMEGLYYIPGTPGDGGGGTTIAIMKDHKFVILAFATLIVGNWEVQETHPQKLVLSPLNPEGIFMVFGRKNPEIKNGARVYFSNPENAETYMQTASGEMKRIFNKDANCFQTPYVLDVENIPEQFFFADTTEEISYGDEEILEGKPKQLYRFSTQGYNEFLVEYYNPSKMHESISFEITKDGIISADGYDRKIIKRKPIPQTGEDAAFIQQAEQIYKELYRANFKWVNEDFRVLDNLKSPVRETDYRFDAKKNNYTIKFNNYEDGYLKRKIIYKFNKIIPETELLKPFKPAAGSIFTAKCEEEAGQ